MNSNDLLFIPFSRVNMDALKGDINQLGEKVKKLISQLESSSTDVHKQFSTFLTSASKEVALVNADIQEIEAISKDLAEYLGEDPKSFKMEESFTILR